MKKLAITFLIGVFGFAAHADFVEGRLQPLSKTQLVEVSAGQILPGTSELVIFIEDGAQEPSMATHLGVSYVLSEKSVDPCGNVTYDGISNERLFQAIAITDHSLSRCDVAYPAVQEVTVTRSGIQKFYQGTPEFTYSILD